MANSVRGNNGDTETDVVSNAGASSDCFNHEPIVEQRHRNRLLLLPPVMPTENGLQALHSTGFNQHVMRQKRSHENTHSLRRKQQTELQKQHQTAQISLPREMEDSATEQHVQGKQPKQQLQPSQEEKPSQKTEETSLVQTCSDVLQSSRQPLNFSSKYRYERQQKTEMDLEEHRGEECTRFSPWESIPPTALEVEAASRFQRRQSQRLARNLQSATEEQSLTDYLLNGAQATQEKVVQASNSSSERHAALSNWQCTTSYKPQINSEDADCANKDAFSILVPTNPDLNDENETKIESMPAANPDVRKQINQLYIQRDKEPMPHCSRRNGLCDATDSSRLERGKARVKRKKFGASDLHEGEASSTLNDEKEAKNGMPTEDLDVAKQADESGTEPIYLMDPRCSRRIGLCDATDSSHLGRTKMRVQLKKFGANYANEDAASLTASVPPEVSDEKESKSVGRQSDQIPVRSGGETSEPLTSPPRTRRKGLCDATDSARFKRTRVRVQWKKFGASDVNEDASTSENVNGKY